MKIKYVYSDGSFFVKYFRRFVLKIDDTCLIKGHLDIIKYNLPKLVKEIETESNDLKILQNWAMTCG